MKRSALILLFALGFSCKETELKNSKESYGVVIDAKSTMRHPLLKGPSTQSTVIRFYLNEKDSFTFGTTYYDVLQNGDKYIVTYDSLDPSGMYKQKIHRTKPLFLKQDVTATTHGTITEAYENKSDSTLSYVGFKYDAIKDTAKKQSFSRYQNILRKNYPLAKIGSKYKVVYLKSNPINAVIYLENKIDD